LLNRFSPSEKTKRIRPVPTVTQTQGVNESILEAPTRIEPSERALDDAGQAVKCDEMPANRRCAA
jgi:hypothetical protein